MGRCVGRPALRSTTSWKSAPDGGVRMMIVFVCVLGTTLNSRGRCLCTSVVTKPKVPSAGKKHPSTVSCRKHTRTFNMKNLLYISNGTYYARRIQYPPPPTCHVIMCDMPLPVAGSRGYGGGAPPGYHICRFKLVVSTCYFVIFAPISPQYIGG